MRHDEPARSLRVCVLTQCRDLSDRIAHLRQQYDALAVQGILNTIPTLTSEIREYRRSRYWRAVFPARSPEARIQRKWPVGKEGPRLHAWRAAIARTRQAHRPHAPITTFSSALTESLDQLPSPDHQPASQGRPPS